MVVILTCLISSALLRLNRPALKIILGLKVVFLVAGAVLAIRLGPFVDGDAWQAIVTGMVLVAWRSRTPPTEFISGQRRPRH
jgi:hypothetical protein